MRLMETGHIFKLRTFWSPPPIKCMTTNYLIQVGMEYTTPLLFFLILSNIFAITLLILEIVFYRYSNQKLSKMY